MGPQERVTSNTTTGDTLTSEAPHVELRNVGHVYSPEQDPVEALANIDISVEHGDIVGIVGASGCGKSTLLRILAGLLEPSSGSVHIDGDATSGILGDVGLIFQNYDNTLLKWRTVFENVALGAELGQQAGDVDEITSEHLELVGLEDFRDANPQDLSGGMKQRVQVARILAYDPDVLLCDEPFGALDVQTKEKLQDQFLEILDQKDTTTIFVTHDIEEAIFMSDSVYIFTDANPGMIGEEMEIDFDRPRYPKTDFETSHFDELVELKSYVQERMEL